MKNKILYLIGTYTRLAHRLADKIHSHANRVSCKYRDPIRQKKGKKMLLDLIKNNEWGIKMSLSDNRSIDESNNRQIINNQITSFKKECPLTCGNVDDAILSIIFSYAFYKGCEHITNVSKGR